MSNFGMKTFYKQIKGRCGAHVLRGRRTHGAAPPYFFNMLWFIRTLAGPGIKRQKVQPAYADQRIDRPRNPPDPEEGFHQIKVEKSDEPPVYGTDNADRESDYIPYFHQ